MCLLEKGSACVDIDRVNLNSTAIGAQVGRSSLLVSGENGNDCSHRSTAGDHATAAAYARHEMNGSLLESPSIPKMGQH